mmetsp:Transcript_17108/g.51177  ORF Transcript_17108/g.51177 Transcript_17108/m.51177 type:complete len:379 (-) Transcript_17108:81-1217(-)
MSEPEQVCELADHGRTCLKFLRDIHAGGLSSALAVLMAGGFHVFPGRFEAGQMKRDMDHHEVSCTIVVPAMLTALSEAAPLHQTYPGVKRLLVGGGTPTPDVTERCRQMFPSARVVLSYAMTEACSSMTFLTLAQPQPDYELSSPAHVEVARAVPEQVPAAAICVGWPAAGIEIAVQQLGEIGKGEGVIQTRGPHAMLGYWADGGLDLAAKPDMWLSTGDIGYLGNDGQLWLLGRGKDTIRTGSETVHASEVERCLQLHPAVIAAAVVGLPDTRLGQQVAALVQIQDDCSSWPGTILPRQQQIPSDAPEAPDPTFLQTLQAFCRAAGLSGFKVPRVILGQTDPLPINASGKLVKADVSRLIRSAQLRWQYSEGPRSRL